MKFALANARRKMKDKVIISFFFNARGDDLEKSTIGMYRSLLLQLLEQLPQLYRIFGSFRSIQNDRPLQWTVESLKDLFEQAVLALGEVSLVCFIDALDECDEDQIRDMISLFENAGQQATLGGISFRICLSSRYYPCINISKGLNLALEEQEEHSQDITSYLNSELKIGQNKLAEEIRIALKEKASGVFMWVVLVVGILQQDFDHGRKHLLRQRLRDIPSDLHELFRSIITRDDNNRDELLLCIQWVLFARQPLKPDQLYFAILSGSGIDLEGLPDYQDIEEDDIRKFILSSSKGLAEITTLRDPNRPIHS